MPPDNQIIKNLTKRQKECLDLVNNGYSSKEIAGILVIAPNTVDSHIATAMSALGASTRGQAARLMLSHETSEKFTSKPDYLVEPKNTEHIPEVPSDVGKPDKRWSLLLTTLNLRGKEGATGFWNKLIIIIQISLLSTFALAATVLLMSGIVAILS